MTDVRLSEVEAFLNSQVISMQGFKESFKAQNFKLDNSCQTNDEDLPGFQNLAGLTCPKTKPTMFFLKRSSFYYFYLSFLPNQATHRPGFR
jgi:hypothetical protein